MSTHETTKFIPGSGNVFADLGLDDADEQMAKAELASQIRRLIEERGLNQTQAAALLGTTQARVSELYNGKIARMTYDRLLGFLNALDCDVAITVSPRRAEGLPARGRILVASV